MILTGRRENQLSPHRSYSLRKKYALLNDVDWRIRTGLVLYLTVTQGGWVGAIHSEIEFSITKIN